MATSTGRGGAGNIGQDPTIYTDGSIVREGAEGVSLEGEYSTGRGGSGNIGPGASNAQAKRLSLATGRRMSEDVIPEPAMREVGHQQQNFHTGRGGEGNIHKDKYGGHSNARSEATAAAAGGSGSDEKLSVPDKIKHALGIGRNKSRSRSRTRNEE